MSRRSTKIRIIVQLCALVGFCCLGKPGTANAEDEATRPRPPVATWGKTTISAGVRYASQNFGAAIGGGAGYTLGPGIYLGNQADYYFGRGAFSGWSVLLEGGYDFGIGSSIVLRPVVGAGAVNTKLKGCEGDHCSETRFAFGLGAQAYWFLTSWLNLGVDVRAIFSERRLFVASVHLGVAY